MPSTHGIVITGRWLSKYDISSPLRSALSSIARRSLSTKEPSIAPRVIIDTKKIRQNPQLYTDNCTNRNYRDLAQNSFKIVKLFDEWQAVRRNGRELREKTNYLRTKLSHAPTFSGRGTGDRERSESRDETIEEARRLKPQLEIIESQEGRLESEINDLATELPNLTSAETPIGTDHRVIGYVNEHPKHPLSAHDRMWRNHVHIGNELGIIDFTAGGITSGWGWYYLKHEAALLEQALIQYAISIAMKRGFVVVSPPSMVYTHISNACGFRPRDQNGEQQVYSIQQSSKDQEKDKPSLSLAGTAEIPFASMKANTTFEEGELPLKVIGSSRCYRAEAGSRGVETKGLYRVHEFTKVEMFGWTMPGDSDAGLFSEMVDIQTEILGALGLHCRILEMPSTDLGASAIRKQDIEAHFPSRMDRDAGWGEVTSTSMCTDYQTRRLRTRVKYNGIPSFPHTVNGTALAVPRILAALLENNWDEGEMCVRIPKVLLPWMFGKEVIKRKH
ncbi:Serine--tRNA ligase, mitochondrial [Bachmanniomyces sp. S44760]|nr:Serine--tRNA ligase, mitochondrial [Bachmanniomyces sp. S44760]